MPENLQEAKELPRHGHCKLSKFMAMYPEVAIFKRFSDLNTYNLLALQSELCYLRYKFHEAVKDDYAASKSEKRTPLDHNLRLQSQSNSEQWKILLLIRDKVNEYSTIQFIQHLVWQKSKELIYRYCTAAANRTPKPTPAD
jgi:hypothetical protein